MGRKNYSTEFTLTDSYMFKRLSNLIRGFFSLFVSGLEKKSPEALLEVEKENLREQISKYNKGLAAHAGLCEPKNCLGKRRN